MSTAARIQIAGTDVSAVKGDLSAEQVDAVVNAANEALQHGGGVAAALSRAGGPAVQEQSDRWIAEHGPLVPGGSAITGGGDLPARWIVHVAGPRYRAGQDNEGLLRRAVEAALDGAARVGAKRVALPAISAGIFGYPPDEAARVIVATVRSWLAGHPAALSEIRLVGYDDAAAARFAAALTGSP